MNVEITTESQERLAIEKEADQEIRDFEQWFMRLGNTGGLTLTEIAILKTYLGWKLGLHKDRG